MSADTVETTKVDPTNGLEAIRRRVARDKGVIAEARFEVAMMDRADLLAALDDERALTARLRADLALRGDGRLRDVVEKLIAWTEKYPSSRVFDYGTIKKIAAEIDAIAEEGRAALSAAPAPKKDTDAAVGWWHDATVGYLPDGSYRAVCICGWTGGRYLIRSSCQQDAEEHNQRLNVSAAPAPLTTGEK